MKLEKINYWIMLTANICVVLGVLALVFELNSSTRVAEVAAFQARASAIEQNSREVALSGEFAEILFKYRNEGIESLSGVELLRMRNWEIARISRMEGMYYQYQRGLLEEEEVASMLGSIRNTHLPRWKELGVYGDGDTSILSSSFRKAIER